MNKKLIIYIVIGLIILALSFKMIKTIFQKIQKITRQSAGHEKIFLVFS